METEPKVTCPSCGRLFMQQDDRYVNFACGKSPLHTLSVKLRAEWCPNPECKNTTVVILPTKTAKLGL